MYMYPYCMDYYIARYRISIYEQYEKENSPQQPHVERQQRKGKEVVHDESEQSQAKADNQKWPVHFPLHIS